MMEIGYIIDQRYLSDIAPCEQKPDLGHRANRVINRESYFAYCDSKLRSPLYLQPRFRCPELYFWVYKNRLRVLGSDLELPMDREWTLSLQEKVVRTLGPEWQRESLSIIYHFLREQPFSEYYNALMSFKWAAHLLSFPLFDWYDRIQLVDGKLFGLLPRSKGKNSEYTWQLLTEDTVGIEIQRYGGKSEIGYRKKTNLTQCLVMWHQHDPYAQRESQERNWAVRYREGVLEYMSNMAAARFSQEAAGTLYPLSLGGLSGELRCSEALEHTLSTLTGGNVEKLELFAELFARVFCTTIPSKHLWYIYGNSATFFRWLYQLAEGKISSTLYISNQNKSEKGMIYDQTQEILLQWNKDVLTAEQLSHLNHSRLKRYIEGGAEIEIDDPYQTEETAAYTPAVLFLAEGDGIDTEKAFKKLPVKKLYIPDDWRIPTLLLADIQWLKTCFVARGLQIVQGFDRCKEQEGQTGLEQVVRQFAEDFCETGSDSRTDCKMFYAALKNYIAALPYEVDLEGSTTTSRLIETYMGWERLADRKNNNRLAFEGVQLDVDKLDSAIAKAQEKKEQRKQEQAARDFHTYLTETSNLVLWPPNQP